METFNGSRKKKENRQDVIHLVLRGKKRKKKQTTKKKRKRNRSQGNEKKKTSDQLITKKKKRKRRREKTECDEAGNNFIRNTVCVYYCRVPCPSNTVKALRRPMLTEEYEHLSSVQAACTPPFTI